MTFQFERKFFSQTQLMALDENFITFTNEYGKQELGYHPVYYEDVANGILFFDINWIMQCSERKDEPAFVVFVQCKEGYFRFYYQEFYHQTRAKMIYHNAFEQVMKEIQPVTTHRIAWTIWTIFKIEIVEFQTTSNLNEKVEFYMQNILASFLRQPRPKKDGVIWQYKSKIMYVDQYFSTIPEHLFKYL